MFACRYTHRFEIRPDSEARRFIETFDREEPVSPCEIDLGESKLIDREGWNWDRKDEQPCP